MRKPATATAYHTAPTVNYMASGSHRAQNAALACQESRRPHTIRQHADINVTQTEKEASAGASLKRRCCLATDRTVNNDRALLSRCVAGRRTLDPALAAVMMTQWSGRHQLATPGTQAMRCCSCVVPRVRSWHELPCAVPCILNGLSAQPSH